MFTDIAGCIYYFTRPELQQRFSSGFVQASFGTVHVSFSTYKDVRGQVYANRGMVSWFGLTTNKRCCPTRNHPFKPYQFLWTGAGLVATQTRARPNEFHFRRQVIILQRAGGGSAERQFSETCWRSRIHCLDKRDKLGVPKLLSVRFKF